MRGLVLSLFPGIGLLDMAFEEAGFCVVRGPDLLWGGDVRRFHPPAGRFDGVIGGPPCQAFSRLRHIVEANGYEVAADRIPEFERVVRQAHPGWFLMENVPDAPLPAVEGFGLRAEVVADHWVGGITSRLRRFSFGCRWPFVLERFHVETAALHVVEPERAALASGGFREQPVAIGGSGKRKDRGRMENLGFKTDRDFRDHCRKQGLPDGFDLPPFTTAAKVKAVGNGVPLAMGRAVAAAVVRAIGAEQREAAE